MLIAVDPGNVEGFSNALLSQGISNWIVGTIDDKDVELVRISKEVNYIEIEKA